MWPASGEQMQNVFTTSGSGPYFILVWGISQNISRRNKAAAYLHSRICKDHDIEITDKWYEYKPENCDAQ